MCILPPVKILEAMLTGESVPVSKNLKPVLAASGLGDRKCMVWWEAVIKISIFSPESS